LAHAARRGSVSLLLSDIHVGMELSFAICQSDATTMHADPEGRRVKPIRFGGYTPQNWLGQRRD